MDAIYNYWIRFESWRDFSLQAEVHDLDQASCREEKRWMMKENEKMIRDLKKAEYRRLNTLIELAMKLDPRLRRVKEVCQLVLSWSFAVSHLLRVDISG